MRNCIAAFIFLVSPILSAAPVQKDMCKVLLSHLASEYIGECDGTLYTVINQTLDGSTLNFKVNGAPLIQILMSPTPEEDNLLKNYGIECDRDQINVTYNRRSDGMPVLQKLQVLDGGKLGLFNGLDSESISCLLNPSK